MNYPPPSADEPAAADRPTEGGRTHQRRAGPLPSPGFQLPSDSPSISFAASRPGGEKGFLKAESPSRFLEGRHLSFPARADPAESRFPIAACRKPFAESRSLPAEESWEITWVHGSRAPDQGKRWCLCPIQNVFLNPYQWL